MPNFFIVVVLLENVQTTSSRMMFTSCLLSNHKSSILHSMPPLNLLGKTHFSMVWRLPFYDWVHFQFHYNSISASECPWLLV